MKWLLLTPYCKKSGEWFIAKYYLGNEVVKYGLYHFNEDKGLFNTEDEAKAKALELKNG
jgi:hypothetical protein